MPVAANVTASSGVTSNSSPSSTCESSSAPATPMTRPDPARTRPSSEHAAQDAGAVGAERHADAELARALAHREREHAADADGGDGQREHREAAEERRVQPRRRDALRGGVESEPDRRRHRPLRIELVHEPSTPRAPSPSSCRRVAHQQRRSRRDLRVGLVHRRQDALHAAELAHVLGDADDPVVRQAPSSCRRTTTGRDG